MTQEKITSGLYHFQGMTAIGSFARFFETLGKDKTRLWHVRIRHMSERGLLGGHWVEKMRFYIMTWVWRVNFSTAAHWTWEIVGCLHSDLWGPSQGSVWFLLLFFFFIDDVSRKVWICLRKHKSEAVGQFKSWKAMIEKQIRRSCAYQLIEG